MFQQFFQVFHDPVADVLDDIYSKIPSPLANYELENIGDINLIRKHTSLSCSASVSLRSLYQYLQSYQESNEE